MTQLRAGSRSAEPGAARSSDAELLTRIANGEIGALGEIYDRHREAVRRFVARMTADAEDVDDLEHATFLAAARSASQYDSRLSCRPWLLGISAQLLLRRRRSVGRLLAVLSSFAGVQVGSVDPRPALHARTDVERALGRLGEGKRVAFLLAKVEGLSCDEIALALGVPVGTVWTRLHAARVELRALLEAGETS